MALPIKDTPILRGKDAEDFEKKTRADAVKKIPDADHARAVEIYEIVKAKEKENLD